MADQCAETPPSINSWDMDRALYPAEYSNPLSGFHFKPLVNSADLPFHRHPQSTTAAPNLMSAWRLTTFIPLRSGTTNYFQVTHPTRVSWPFKMHLQRVFKWLCTWSLPPLQSLAFNPLSSMTINESGVYPVRIRLAVQFTCNSGEQPGQLPFVLGSHQPTVAAIGAVYWD